MNTRNTLNQPADPYDTAAWLAFYDQNPGFRRGVGAEGVNDEDTGDNDDKPKDNPKSEDKPKDDPKPEDKDKMSDADAALLKDVMKQKQARKEAEARAAELEKRFEGVDLDEYTRLRTEREDAAAAAAKAEEDAAIARGDFDKVRSQMAEQHEAAIEAVRTELTTENESLKADLDKSKAIIEELTVGSQFSSSKFVTDETVYTPSKARRLYGDHFDVLDGKVVAYDAPRGKEGRSVIVDSKGNPAPFDTAMRRIIEADPEKDEILIDGLKPGAQSAAGGAPQKKETAPVTSRDKIKSGITDLMGSIDKASDNFKLG